MEDGLSNLFVTEQSFPPIAEQTRKRMEEKSYGCAVALLPHLSCEATLLAFELVGRYGRTRRRPLCAAETVGCFVVAAKYEDGILGKAPAKMCESAGVDHDEVLRHERVICLSLDFAFCWPNPIHFLRWFSHEVDGWNGTTRRIAKALLLIYALNGDDDGSLPSLRAAAALHAAKKVSGCGSWTPYHVAVSRHPQGDVKAYADRMLKAACDSITSGKFPFVSLMSKQEMTQVLNIGTCQKTC
jgi:hypothetical protein